MKNGIKFNVCGLNFKYFVPFFQLSCCVPT